MSGTIAPNTHLFATYVGLTAAGYDMADDQDQETMLLVDQIQSLEWPDEVLRYFCQARTGQVKVNPYWPRASMLSAASLYIGAGHVFSEPDRHELIQSFLQADNLGPDDKSQETLAWVVRLPEAIKPIMEHPSYAELWANYLVILQRRAGKWEETVRHSLQSLSDTMGVPAGTLPAVEFVPNLLQSPYIADYTMRGHTLIVIRTEPDPISIVHELLHHLLDESVREAVMALNVDRWPDVVNLEQMKAMGYAWSDDRESLTRILQESCARAASIWVVHRDHLAEAQRVCDDYVNQGFLLIPDLLSAFDRYWQGLSSLQTMITRLLT